MSVEAVARAVDTMARVAERNEQRYGELDAAAGDGDFGFVFADGWRRVRAVVAELDPATPGDYLTAVARGFTRVGGTTGPVWGTAFLRAAGAVDERAVLTTADVVDLLRAAAQGITERGGAEVGDKTLLDALVPAVDALAEAVREGADPVEAGKRAAAAARQGAERTTELVARRGRASYQGERSKGAPDPGAVAVADMAEALAELAGDAPG